MGLTVVCGAGRSSCGAPVLISPSSRGMSVGDSCSRTRGTAIKCAPCAVRGGNAASLVFVVRTLVSLIRLLRSCRRALVEW